MRPIHSYRSSTRDALDGCAKCRTRPGRQAPPTHGSPQPRARLPAPRARNATTPRLRNHETLQNRPRTVRGSRPIPPPRRPRNGCKSRKIPLSHSPTSIGVRERGCPSEKQYRARTIACRLDPARDFRATIACRSLPRRGSENQRRRLAGEPEAFGATPRFPTAPSKRFHRAGRTPGRTQSEAPCRAALFAPGLTP